MRTQLIRSRVCFLLVLLSFSTSAAYAQCGSLAAPTLSAIAGGGDFNSPGTWIGVLVNHVPDSTTNTCIINGTLASPTTVTLTTGGNVHSLQVNSNNILNVSPAAGLVVNGPQIINNGSIGLNGSGGNRAILFLNADTTLSGTGTLTMSGNIALIEELSSATGSGGTGLTLTNASNIVGAGVIGNGGLSLANTGTINANASAQTLFLNGQGNGTVGVTNTGLLSASGGGILELSTTVANAGGNITANGGTVIVGNPFGGLPSTINGGTLNSMGGGTIQTLAGNGAALNGVTLTAGTTYINPGDAAVSVSGTITNNGNIQVNGNGAAASAMILTGNTTLSGSGTVTLSYNNPLFVSAGIAGASQMTGLILTNSSTQTIQGAGAIQGGGLTLVNNGTINANSPTGLTLIVGGLAGITNTGLMEATTGGVLDLTSAINNTGGAITANGGTVNVTTAITGGTLNSINGGTLQTPVDSSATLNGVTISTGTTFINRSDSVLLVSGTITNNGVIQLDAATFTSFLEVKANTTLLGGTVTMAEGSGTPSIQAAAAGLTLTNSSTSTIQGAGVIGNTGPLTLVNNGTVNANSSGKTLFLDSNANGGVTNAGLLEATNNGTLQISTVINNAGGNITANGGAVLSNSTIQGGTLNTFSGGTMGTNPGFNSTLDGSTHGALTISAGSTYTNGNASNLITLGNIINNGNIAVTAGSSNSFLFLNNNTTLNGNGTVTLSTTGLGTAIILQENGPLLTLTNASNTIQGAGQIGGFGGALTVNNRAAGTINANTSGQTLFVNGVGTLTNAGTLEASGGGKLLVSSPLAGAASGGFTSGTLTGNYIVDGSAGHLSTLQINALGSLGNEVTTLGNGVLASSITLNGTNANTVFTDSSAGVHNALNLGAVTANASLTVEGGYAMTTTAAGGLSNAGSVTVGTGSSLTVTAAAGYTQSAGFTTVNGTLVAPSVTINGGVLQGTGIVDPPVGATTIASGGTLLPGAAGTPGTITIGGALNINSGGTLLETINNGTPGSGFGVTNVTGALTLGATSTLDILQSGSFNPGIGTEITIMTAGTPVVGTFALENQFFNGGAEKWTVLTNQFGGDNVVLMAASNSEITATWTGASGNWTANSGNPSFTTNWTCSVTVATGCVPINGGSAYAAVLNSPGSTMTLSGSDHPNSITVDSVNIQKGTLVVTGAGTSLSVLGGLTNGDTLNVAANGAVTAGSLTNNGTINLSSGTITATALTNYSGGVLTGGIYNLGTGTTLQVTGLGSGGGEITTIAANTTVNLNGAGAKIADSTSNDALSALANNKGTFSVNGGATFTTSSALNNSGTLTVGAGSTVNAGTLGNKDYTTGGTTNVTGALNANNVTDSGVTHVFNNGVLTAAGTYAESNSMTIDNGGKLSAGAYNNSGATVINGLLDTTNYTDSSGGTTTIGSGGVLTASGTYTENGGVLDIAAGGTLDATAFSLQAGKMQVDGTLDPPSIDILSGTEMFGTGTIIGNVTNSGEIFPGDDPTPGTLTINGDYLQASGGVFMEDIGADAASVGLLNVTGTGNVTLDPLASTLDIGSLGFTPFFHERFTVLTFSGIENGMFANVIGVDAGDFDVLYNSGNIQLQWNQGGTGATPEPKFVLLDLALLGILVAWKSRRRVSGGATNEYE
jgi:hypothetical protein